MIVLRFNSKIVAKLTLKYKDMKVYSQKLKQHPQDSRVKTHNHCKRLRSELHASITHSLDVKIHDSLLMS